MRIAFAMDFALYDGGGVSALVANLVEDFLPGNEVILISRDADNSFRKDSIMAKLHKHFQWKCRTNPPSKEFSVASKNLLAQLIDAKPDLVHFHCGLFSWGNRWPMASWPTALHAQGIPSVWTNHSVVNLLSGYCGEQKPLWFKLAMLPLSYLGKSQQMAATAWEICVSDHDLRKIRRWYFPFRKKVSRIYHSTLKEAEIMYSATPREKIILAVGHIAFRKGQHILVQAFGKISRRHPSWKLFLVGPESKDGCGDWIRNFSDREGLTSRVTLVGQRNDAMDWMKKCSIFVQPSLQEALGLALQEAMACGCACIGTKAGGIPELIQNEFSGLICNAGDAVQLAKMIEFMILNPDKRKKYGLAAVGHIKTVGMTRSAMIEAHRKIYTKLCVS